MNEPIRRTEREALRVFATLLKNGRLSSKVDFPTYFKATRHMGAGDTPYMWLGATRGEIKVIGMKRTSILLTSQRIIFFETPVFSGVKLVRNYPLAAVRSVTLAGPYSMQTISGQGLPAGTLELELADQTTSFKVYIEGIPYALAGQARDFISASADARLAGVPVSGQPEPSFVADKPETTTPSSAETPVSAPSLTPKKKRNWKKILLVVGGIAAVVGLLSLCSHHNKIEGEWGCYATQVAGEAVQSVGPCQVLVDFMVTRGDGRAFTWNLNSPYDSAIGTWRPGPERGQYTVEVPPVYQGTPQSAWTMLFYFKGDTLYGSRYMGAGRQETWSFHRSSCPE